MASPCTYTLRRLPQGARLYLRPVQKRAAQVHDVRFFALHAPRQNKYLDKYKDKLEQKAQETGAKNVDDLITKAREQPSDSTQASQPAASTSPFPPPPPPPQVPNANSHTAAQQAAAAAASAAAAAASPFKQKNAVKTLSSFLDVEKVASLPPTEIEALWRLRHASNARSLCASIPAPLFARIALTARKHPQFILPIPRTAQKEGEPAAAAKGGEIGDGTGGADIHFLQWTFPSPTTATVLFTHLAEYKARGEYAAPHTTITHHSDFARDKGLVLLEGNVMPDRGVSVEEGKWLVMCLQKFYGAFEKESEERAVRRGELLRQFSSGDAGFEVGKLLEEAERIG